MKTYLCPMKKRVYSGILLFLAGLGSGISSCTYQPYAQGKRLYLSQCADCHMDDGSGLEQLIPALAGSDFLLSQGAETACLIKLGAKDSLFWSGRFFYGDMPPHPNLNATEITNILNYTRNAWGNQAPPIKVQEVEKVLQKCKR